MKKLTTEEFIERAKSIHGDKYDYSKVKYEGMTKHVCIICPEHGEFWQTPINHLSGKGCYKCGKEASQRTRFKSVANSVVERFKKVHGDKYDYSKVKYVNAHTKVCIICPEHGEFWQTPYNHLYGYGCKKCAMDILTANNLMSADEFIEKAKKIHGDKYDYSKVEYKNCKTKVCIICPEHGEFWQTPDNHIGKRTHNGCPMCAESKLEQEIRVLLTEHSVNFEYNKSKKWLKGLRLDFYLPEYKIAIECQGKQHFEPVDFGGKGYEKSLKDFLNTKKYDLLKKQRCKENGVKLLYYSDRKNENEMITDKEELLGHIV